MNNSGVYINRKKYSNKEGLFMNKKEIIQSIILRLTIAIAWGVVLFAIKRTTKVDIPAWFVGLSTGLIIGVFSKGLAKRILNK